MDSGGHNKLIVDHTGTVDRSAVNSLSSWTKWSTFVWCWTMIDTGNVHRL